MARATRISARRCARALWLLGLREPADIDEVRAAWKARVAQTHPDRHGDHPGAAHRLTAAFNDARDVCERWAAAGLPWPSPGRRVVSLWEAEEEDDEPVDDELDERPSARVPTAEERRGEARSGLRPGDAVRAAGAGEDEYVLAGRVVRVSTASAAAPVLVELDDGSVHAAAGLEPASFGCPVCGAFCGPWVERWRRRPCPACLGDLARLERRAATPDAVVQAMGRRARDGRERADALGEHGLGQLARERLRFMDALRRRPREERREALLAAFAHGFAVWGEALADQPRADAAAPEP